jgi:hypothetical protein
MKKLSYLLGLLVVAGIIFSACAKDEEEPDPPTVNFLGGIYTPWGVERTFQVIKHWRLVKDLCSDSQQLRNQIRICQGFW